MAILTVTSDLLTTTFYRGTPKDAGHLRVEVFNIPIPVQADAGSTLRLCRVPQHAVLIPNLSWIQCTATTSLTVALGWEAYVNADTDAVVPANTVGLGTQLTIAAGTAVLFSAFPAAPLAPAFTGDAVLTALTAAANIAAAGVVAGCVTYAFYH